MVQQLVDEQSSSTKHDRRKIDHEQVVDLVAVLVVVIAEAEVALAVDHAVDLVAAIAVAIVAADVGNH
jgi:hypothetical protein